MTNSSLKPVHSGQQQSKPDASGPEQSHGPSDGARRPLNLLTHLLLFESFVDDCGRRPTDAEWQDYIDGLSV